MVNLLVSSRAGREGIAAFSLKVPGEEEREPVLSGTG
jgi:hypothetical protein